MLKEDDPVVEAKDGRVGYGGRVYKDYEGRCELHAGRVSHVHILKKNHTRELMDSIQDEQVNVTTTSCRVRNGAAISCLRIPKKISTIQV